MRTNQNKQDPFEGPLFRFSCELQKTYLSANCIMRGPPEGEITAPGLQPVGEAMGALHRILPKLPLEKFISGLPRWTLFVTLKASALNSICWPSAIWNFLDTV